MARILKYLAIAAGVIVLAVLALALYVAATFNPNEYKPQITQLVKDRTGRTLKLDGDIKLTFFPSIGADLGRLSLSEPASDKEFAAVDGARVSVKLLPLLAREFVVGVVEIQGLRAQLVRHKDGSTSIDDLMSAGGGKPAPAKKAPEKKQGGEAAPLSLDVDQVLIENSSVKLTDEAAKASYAISDLRLKTGRIANAVPSDVELGFKLAATQPKLGVAARASTRLTFELDARHYRLDGLDLEIKGDAAGFSGLNLAAKGDIDARPGAGSFTLAKFAVSLSGKRGGDAVEAKLSAPALTLTADKVGGDKISGEASLEQPSGKSHASFSIAGLEGNAKAFRSSEFAVEIDAKQGENAIKGKLASPVSGSVDAERFELSKLAADLTVHNPKLPNGTARLSLSGTVQADLPKQTAGTSISGKLDESTISGKAGVTHFDPPTYAFDLDIDKLDVDRYAPPEKKAAAKPDAGGKADAGKAPAGAAEPPLDLAALKTLNASGAARIGTLKVSNLHAQNVRVQLKAAGGRLEVNPLAANLYQGTMNGSLAVNAAAVPQIAVKQNLTGISIGPLLKDVADKDVLEGKGNVALDLSGQGASVAAIKRALAGSASLNLTDGALKGINIAGSIREAKAKLGALKGEKTQAASATEKTDFSEMKASFAIKNGVAHNSDLSLKSPLLRLGGEGDIDIGHDSIDYLAKATLVASAEGQGGKDTGQLKGLTVPVRISGPFSALSYKLDFGAMAEGMAREKVEEKKEEIKSQVQDKLKGLFGR